MASVIHTVGQYTYKRMVKQGAPQKTESQLRRHPVMVRLTDAEFERYLAAKRKTFLRASEFAALVMDAGIEQLFVTDNCSKS